MRDLPRKRLTGNHTRVISCQHPAAKACAGEGWRMSEEVRNSSTERRRGGADYSTYARHMSFGQWKRVQNVARQDHVPIQRTSWLSFFSFSCVQ